MQAAIGRAKPERKTCSCYVWIEFVSNVISSQVFTHVLMNLPAIATEFTDVFRSCCRAFNGS